MVQIEPVLEAMEDVMGRLAHAVEGRVYVAVCRGLWDITAKEVFDYLEGLQEGKENKVCSPVRSHQRELLNDEFKARSSHMA